jgi:hypothetical protein
MAPLNPNSTDRAWLKYTSMGTEHELMFRQPDATPQADIIANAVGIANALKSFMWTGDSFIGLRHADGGSNLSFPLAWTAIAGTNDTTPVTDDEAKFVAVAGRSLGGRRSRMTFFTPYPSDALGYRTPAPGSFAPGALWTAVQGMEPPNVAVDEQEVIWNSYINIGYNSYWQRQLR